MKCLLALLFLVGCGRPGEPDPAAPDARAVIAEQADAYRVWLTGQQDSYGFVQSDCDATLFSGLAGAAGAVVDLTAAEPDPGRWLRRSPAAGLECWTGGESKSTISRDMLLGVMWWAWARQDLGTLERLWQYGEDHAWVMGQGDPARTILTPGLASTLAAEIHRLGGADHSIRQLPAVWDPTLGDFQAHLQALDMLLRARVGVPVTVVDRATAAVMYARHPTNPLIAELARELVAGPDGDAVAALLRDVSLWPIDRLPGSADRCSPWVTQRDDDRGAASGPLNWRPCADQGRTHTGADFLFVAWLLLGEGV